MLSNVSVTLLLSIPKLGRVGQVRPIVMGRWTQRNHVNPVLHRMERVYKQDLETSTPTSVTID